MSVPNATSGCAPRAGQATLKVEIVHGLSTVTSATASSPMKVLTPVARGKSAWAFTSSFGGGLVAGDQTQLEMSVGPGARCFLGTQSSTKVYRNPEARPCSHTTQAFLAAGSLLVFAPEPVQAFAEARYTQRQEFHLATGAGLVLTDWFTSGRAARGERWAFVRLESRNAIFIDGECAVLDPLLLNSTELHKRMGRFNCLATLVLIGAAAKTAAEAVLQEVAARPVERGASQVCSVSPVRDGILLRIAGAEVQNVRQELQHHLGFIGGLLGDHPWARKW
jgi:urease accessory protein